MNNSKFDKLYGLSSGGKVKVWEIEVVEKEDGTADIITKHGYVDGKMVETVKKIYSGKNIGKVNETTPFMQAVSEAKSTFDLKIRKEYVDDMSKLKDSSSSEILLPTLAHDFNKRSHNIVFPCAIQPKLNGVRSLNRNNGNSVLSTTRTGKIFRPLKHIHIDIMSIFDSGDLIDGELYNHNLDFEDITRAVRNEKDDDPNLIDISLWAYDFPSIEGDFRKRYEALEGKISRMNSDSSIVLVETHICKDLDDIMSWHEHYTRLGYEGIMIRNLKDGGYTFKHRSVNLQKYKTFIDREFEIIGGKEGSGSSEGQCIFRCVTDDGNEFDVRCEGPNSIREEQFRNLDSYIGKHLTVKFQNYSKYGVPIFPVGLTVRDYE